MLLMQNDLRNQGGGNIGGAVRFESSGWQKEPLMARYGCFGLVWLLAVPYVIEVLASWIEACVDRREDFIQPSHYTLATHSF